MEMRDSYCVWAGIWRSLLDDEFDGCVGLGWVVFSSAHDGSENALLSSYFAFDLSICRAKPVYFDEFLCSSC